MLGVHASNLLFSIIVKTMIWKLKAAYKAGKYIVIILLLLHYGVNGLYYDS